MPVYMVKVDCKILYESPFVHSCWPEIEQANKAVLDYLSSTKMEPGDSEEVSIEEWHGTESKVIRTWAWNKIGDFWAWSEQPIFCVG